MIGANLLGTGGMDFFWKGRPSSGALFAADVGERLRLEPGSRGERKPAKVGGASGSGAGSAACAVPTKRRPNGSTRRVRRLSAAASCHRRAACDEASAAFASASATVLSAIANGAWMEHCVALPLSCTATAAGRAEE